MDHFLEYLVTRADLSNSEYYNYRPSSRPKKTAEAPRFVYPKITEPSVQDYVVFDLETTGMRAGADHILEIGAIKVINNEIMGVVNVLVNPGINIPYYITNLTHITNEMVADMNSIDEVLPTFVKFVGDLPLMAHNARFDMSFILAEANKLGIKITNSVLDTLQLSRKYNKECEKHSLGYLTKFYNIPLSNAHRAYHDALATHRLYNIIQKKAYGGV